MDRSIVDTDILVRNWPVVLLRGVLGVLFGITAIVLPGLSFAALVIIFGAYAFANGVLSIISAVRRRNTGESIGAAVLFGVVGIAAGIFTLLRPGITAMTLVYVIGAWAIVGGLLEIGAAIRLRKAIRGEWLLGLSGLLSIGLGIMLLLFPAAGALAIVLWVGAFALIYGIALVALALRLRSFEKNAAPPPTGELHHAGT